MRNEPPLPHLAPRPKPPVLLLVFLATLFLAAIGLLVALLIGLAVSGELTLCVIAVLAVALLSSKDVLWDFRRQVAGQKQIAHRLSEGDGRE